MCNWVNLTKVNSFRMNDLSPSGWAIDEHWIGMLLCSSCLLHACIAVPLRVTMITLPYRTRRLRRVCPTCYIILLSLLCVE